MGWINIVAAEGGGYLHSLINGRCIVTHVTVKRRFYHAQSAQWEALLSRNAVMYNVHVRYSTTEVITHNNAI